MRVYGKKEVRGKKERGLGRGDDEAHLNSLWKGVTYEKDSGPCFDLIVCYGEYQFCPEERVPFWDGDADPAESFLPFDEGGGFPLLLQPLE